jgi:hypothetical protein
MRHLILFICLLLPVTAHAQSSMVMNRGTLSAGGVIQFQSHTMDFANPTPDASVKTVSFLPQFGYFMNSFMAVVGTVGFESISGDTMELSRVNMSGGVRFYQPLAFFHFYLGLEGGLYFTNYDDGDRDAIDVGFSLPLGMLIPMSRSVALDVGARFTKIWRDNDHPAGMNYNSFIVEVGYLGVQAFF